ncbi:MAG: helix-turn-helix transcriptional regulator [Christensenellales bacterium]|nr:helix-turn-helix transcriptional regulator [Clostridiales bacterium]MEE1440583.1 helix-turn-helix transcriptional regulator [Christensenellales bacterium]
MLDVRQARQRVGISQKDLARKVGITQAFLSEVETGTKSPSLLTAAKLARALGCTIDELLGETIDPDQPVRR